MLVLPVSQSEDRESFASNTPLSLDALSQSTNWWALSVGSPSPWVAMAKSWKRRGHVVIIKIFEVDHLGVEARVGLVGDGLGAPSAMPVCAAEVDLDAAVGHFSLDSLFYGGCLNRMSPLLEDVDGRQQEDDTCEAEDVGELHGWSTRRRSPVGAARAVKPRAACAQPVPRRFAAFENRAQHFA